MVSNNNHTPVKKTVYVDGKAVGECESTGDMQADAERVRDFLKGKGLWKSIFIKRFTLP